MTISSAKFTESGNIVAVIDGRTIYVPDDTANGDRQLISEWEKAGNIITPYAAPVVDLPTLDVKTLNDALTQEGSVVRALGLVMFDEINKLRVLGLQTPYTMAQFKTALIAKMRT